MVSTANRPPRPQRPPREPEDTGGFSERVVYTRRIAKVVKGGRRLRFNALVVVGDGMGSVGAGMGKALVIPDAVRKGNAIARRELVKIPIKGSTIPHEITVKVGASIVVIKPAPEGTGIIAAGAMRAILELGGVRDVVGKSLGSRNPINTVQATLEALRRLRDPRLEVARRMAARTPPGQSGIPPQGRPPQARGRPPQSGQQFGGRPPQSGGRPPQQGQQFGGRPPQAGGRPPQSGQQFGGRPPQQGQQPGGRPPQQSEPPPAPVNPGRPPQQSEPPPAPVNPGRPPQQSEPPPAPVNPGRPQQQAEPPPAP